MKSTFPGRFLRGLSVAFAVALLAVTGCGSTNAGEDIFGNFDFIWEDALTPDVPDTVDDGARPDTLDTNVPDAGSDTNAPDSNGPDTNIPDTAVQVDDSPVDTGTPDNGTENPAFCRSFADCEDGEVCDFSLGRCDVRDAWKTGKPALYSYHPPEGSAGDVIVIDASVLYTSMFSAEFSVTADIGGKRTAGGAGNLGVDENRMIGVIPAGASGKVRVVFGDNGGTKIFPVAFKSIPTGVVACDATTPGQMTAGDLPTETGPYAAGYLDVSLNNTRVFYPAECGSVRRPGVPGTYPLLVILHGNGANHINHEHIAQLLATWGVISVMPLTDAANGWSDLSPGQIKDTVTMFRGKTDLATVHPALAGLGTTAQMAMMGHSRGCFRMQEYLQNNASAKDYVVGGIFLGPADYNFKLPGQFLVIGAENDGQGLSSYVNAAYNRQSASKWKVNIKGGNHGNFCDHKIYYSLDGQPTISRHKQLVIVQDFVVPFIQRVFEMDQPFASWLENPPVSSAYTVEKSL